MRAYNRFEASGDVDARVNFVIYQDVFPESKTTWGAEGGGKERGGGREMVVLVGVGLKNEGAASVQLFCLWLRGIFDYSDDLVVDLSAVSIDPLSAYWLFYPFHNCRHSILIYHYMGDNRITELFKVAGIIYPFQFILLWKAILAINRSFNGLSLPSPRKVLPPLSSLLTSHSSRPWLPLTTHSSPELPLVLPYFSLMPLFLCPLTNLLNTLFLPWQSPFFSWIVPVLPCPPPLLLP